MSPITLIVILLVVGVILSLALVIYMQQSFKKAVVGKILCTFITKAAQSYDVLLPVTGSCVTPPESAITSSAVKKLGYYKLPEKPATVSYPLWGWPTSFRSEVRRAFYVEGDPNPIEPPDRQLSKKGKEMLEEKKEDGTIPVTSVALRRLIKAESAQHLIGAAGREFSKEGSSSIKPAYLWLSLGGIVVLVIVAAVIAYMTYADLHGLTSYWGL